MSDYRERMYRSYVTGFRGREARFDAAAATHWAKPYDHYFRQWLPVDRNARIADLACGDGQFLYFLKSRGYANVRGVDISAEQVALARESGAEVTQGDVLVFLSSLPPASLDLIIALDLIEHLAKDEALRLLEACAHALAPGGRVILQTPNADSPWGGAIRYADFTHETSYTPRLLDRLLSMHGFGEIEAREMGPVPFGYSLASSVRFVAWQFVRAGLQAWNAFETGDRGQRVLTRVFCISAVRAS